MYLCKGETMPEVNSTIPLILVPLMSNPAVKCIRAASTLTPQEHQMHEQLLTELGAAFFCENKREAFDVMRAVETRTGEANLVTETFLAMDTSLKMFITWLNDNTEYSQYPVFQKMIDTLIPGASIVPPPLKHRLKPDFFVEREGLISPVEIKRGTFTNTAVKQLQRYMTAYNCVTGYAVAPKLAGTLASGMMFIEWHCKPE
jgi:hypothetical protein